MSVRSVFSTALPFYSRKIYTEKVTASVKLQGKVKRITDVLEKSLLVDCEQCWQVEDMPTGLGVVAAYLGEKCLFDA